MKFPGPITRELLARGLRVYATTTESSRIIPVKGNGPFVIDPDGFTFFDLHCDAGVNNLGKGNSAVHRAIINQLSTNNEFSEMHSAPNPTGLDLAEVLVERSSVLKPAKAFFSNSGAEANEAARKLCLHYRRHRSGEKQRNKALYFRYGFAGRTAGNIAATSSKPEVQQKHFLTHCDKKHSIYLPYPRLGGDWNELKQQFELLPHKRIDRMLIEIPSQGEGGIIPIEEDALRFLFSRCREEGIFIISDCVQTGMGRVGTLFGCDVFPWFQPDILTMGKALGGGLPNGATLFRADLDWCKGEHSNTFGGGPLVMSAALAAFSEIDALLKSGAVSDLAYHMKNWLYSFCEYPIVTDIRGMGAMWGIEFINAKIRDRIILLGEEFAEYKGCGLRLLGAGRKTIRIMPPLNIDRAQLGYAMKLLGEVIETVNKDVARCAS